jgi:class 3 adenylate cyclase
MVESPRAPVVRTRSCQNRHIGYAVSGSLQVTIPGHDVLVIGEEPWESIEFTSAHTFGVAPEGLGDRVLATVLFSDVVGSTATLERLGDRAWTSILDEHNARIRAAIDRFGGREIVSTGDGFPCVPAHAPIRPAMRRSGTIHMTATSA